ncbi:MAG: arylsulfotransferase family protein [Planctomycetota bacterium]
MKRSLLVALLAFAAGMAFGVYKIPPYEQLRSVKVKLFGHRGKLRALSDEEKRWHGVWHPMRELGTGAEDGSSVADLANVPYLSGTEVAPESQETVLFVDPDAAQPGVNLVVSGHAPEAVLTDLKGQVLHKWGRALEDVWPGPLGFDEWDVHKQFWRHAYLYPNGDLLAVFEGIGIVKLDAQSEVLWHQKIRTHHDTWVEPDGRIFTLTRKSVLEPPESWRTWPLEVRRRVIEDYVTVLSPDGEVEQSVSVVECLLNSRFSGLLNLLRERAGDLLHANAIEVMDGRFADRHPLYAKGQVLVSLPTLSTLAVLNLEAKTVVWAATGLCCYQHDPSVLDDGSIMVFDNLGDGARSRVLVFDPRTEHVSWEFKSTPEREFASKILGAVQRLGNGNALITESTAGRAFEVTPELDVVWDYQSPYRAGDDGDLVASLFHVTRFDPATFTGALAEVLGPEPAAAPLDLDRVKELTGGN